MSSIDLAKIQDLIIDTAADVGIKVLGAIALWVIGRWLIGFTLRMVRSALERQHIDPTVVRYVGSIVSVTLNLIGRWYFGLLRNPNHHFCGFVCNRRYCHWRCLGRPFI